MDIFLLS